MSYLWNCYTKEDDGCVRSQWSTNGFHHRKSIRLPKFNTWTGLFVFHMEPILLGDIRIQLLSHQTWVSRRAAWALKPWYSDFDVEKTLNSNELQIWRLMGSARHCMSIVPSTKPNYGICVWFFVDTKDPNCCLYIWLSSQITVFIIITIIYHVTEINYCCQIRYPFISAVTEKKRYTFNSYQPL